ncbi:MAG: isoprenylcysteine carboxylmethyltransferase family protein [Ignavibacteriae bacterium]|nr:isoprenylcysteine carboxylmethyltransferase family protein [Ignavibacteriota bacterium]MCB9217767.1 isoprenylcysteine carboxylmethyltransferase family protein [Ignavibacteria bacterium]
MQTYRQVIGTLWVFAQLSLIGTWGYFVLCDGDLLKQSILTFDPLLLPAGILFTAGTILLLAGTLKLGSNLTPTPEPKQSAFLVVEGLYSRVRHPIYGGILLMIWGVTLLVFLGEMQFPIVGTALLINLFFTAKSSYEEGRLTQRYPEYRDYKKRTWRFLPKP